MYKILFVCHGNICRSTMAQSVMTELLKRANRLKDFEIDSAGTSSEEEGNPVSGGTAEALRAHKFPCIRHSARQMTYADYDYFDLIIGMDRFNMRNMNRITNGDPDGKCRMLLSRDVADPYYTLNYEATFRDVLEGCTALAKALTE